MQASKRNRIDPHSLIVEWPFRGRRCRPVDVTAQDLYRPRPLVKPHTCSFQGDAWCQKQNANSKQRRRRDADISTESGGWGLCKKKHRAPWLRRMVPCAVLGRRCLHAVVAIKHAGSLHAVVATKHAGPGHPPRRAFVLCIDGDTPPPEPRGCARLREAVRGNTRDALLPSHLATVIESPAALQPLWPEGVHHAVDRK